MFGELLNPVGHDGRLAGTDHVEQIAVRHQAEALVPWIVGRREMSFHIVIRAELLLHHADDAFLELGRLAARHLEQEQLQQNVAPPRDAVGDLRRQLTAKPVRPFVLGRAGHDIGGRTLQHGHVRGGGRHCGDQRHGGCTPLPMTTTRLPV